MFDDAFFTDLQYYLRAIRRKWLGPVTEGFLSLLIASITVGLFGSSEGRKLDLWVLRHFFEVRGQRPPPPNITLIAIDDESYGKLGESTNFPLPRRYFADALEAINEAHPKVVIIDAKIPAQPNMEPNADDRIEAALRSGPTTIWTGEIPDELGVGAPVPTTALSSDARFKKAAKLELPMLVASEDETVLYVSYSAAPNASLYERVPIAEALVTLGKLDIREPGPDDLINFYGPRGTFQRVPIHELAAGAAEKERVQQELRDKVVLVGYQSLSRGRGVVNKDEFEISASSEPMYGLEIHANIVGNLIDRSWIRRPTRKTESRILLLLTLFTAALGVRYVGTRGAAIVIGIAAVVVTSEYVSFSQHAFWVSGIGSYFVSVFLTLLVISIYGVFRVDSFRAYMKRTLGFRTQKRF